MRTPEIKRAVMALVGTALAGASGYFYVGPYRWLAELQLALFGAYVVQITFIGAVLVCALPLMLILKMLERQEIAPEASEGDSLRWSAAVAAVTASPRASQAALIGVVFAIMGTFFAVEELSAGPLTEIDVASLERGEAPASRYVHLVGGTLHGERAQAFGGTHSVEYYYPYVAREGAASVFIEVRSEDREAAFAGPLRGMLERDGLPGSVRVRFEETGEIAGAHWMLRYGREPDRVSLALAFVGLGLLLLIVGLWVVFARRPRHLDGAHVPGARDDDFDRR